MIQVICIAAIYPILAWFGLTTSNSTDTAYKDRAVAHFNISIGEK